MKIFSILILTALPFIFYAQNPKIRYQEGFFSTRYEIGDKDAKHNDVTLHLEKAATPQTYDLWKKGNRQENNAWIWIAVGSGGLLATILYPDSDTQIIGYSTAAVGYSTALVIGLNANKNQKRAIKDYNTANGY